MYRRVISLTIGLVLLVGCGTQSSSETIKTELQSVKSSAATAHMVADALVGGRVPEAYAKDTLQSAQDDLKGSIAKLAPLPEVKAASPSGGTGLEQLQRLQATVTQIYDAAQKGGAVALPPLIQQLATEEDDLSQFAKQMGIEQ